MDTHQFYSVNSTCINQIKPYTLVILTSRKCLKHHLHAHQQFVGLKFVHSLFRLLIAITVFVTANILLLYTGWYMKSPSQMTFLLENIIKLGAVTPKPSQSWYLENVEIMAFYLKARFTVNVVFMHHCGETQIYTEKRLCHPKTCWRKRNSNRIHTQAAQDLLNSVSLWVIHTADVGKLQLLQHKLSG